MIDDTLILPTVYLGPISYYRALCSTCRDAIHCVSIEVWESFPKQTLRNRCRIAGANGVQTLSIPVCKSESKQYTKDVQISYQTAWQHQHWNALRSAYEHTPFFTYYADYFRPFYEQKYTYLLDFNMGLHEVVMALLQNQAPLLSPPQGGRCPDKTLSICERSWKGLTETWSGDKQLDRYFEGDAINGVSTREYHQIFADKHGFQDNLSIVDLLFNMGNEALDYVQRDRLE